MRKIVVTTFISLDGVMENPAWSAPYWNDQIANFKAEETLSSDALLLGRVTYEGFAQAWPGRTDDPGADYFNGVRKYVVSTTLDKVEWNNSRLIKGNIVEAIKKLQQEDGTNITVHGSATLAQFLTKNNLVDEYRMLVYPVVVGGGKRLFSAENAMTKLKLIDTQNFSGVIALRYEPNRAS